MGFTISKSCPMCTKVYTPDLCNREDFQHRFLLWRSGELIQNAFPGTTVFEREQLLSGICSDKCWKDYLGPEDDPDYEPTDEEMNRQAPLREEWKP